MNRRERRKLVVMRRLVELSQERAEAIRRKRMRKTLAILAFLALGSWVAVLALAILSF